MTCILWSFGYVIQQGHAFLPPLHFEMKDLLMKDTLAMFSCSKNEKTIIVPTSHVKTMKCGGKAVLFLCDQLYNCVQSLQF